MNRPPTLTTARLVLFVPKPADLERVLAFNERNAEHFARFSPPPHQGSLAEAVARRVTSAERDHHEDRGLVLVAVAREDPRGPVLAEIQFSNVVRGAFQACHLGYKLDGACEGQGLMAEALTAAIAYVFEEMRLHRVMANHQPTNERSGRLLRRLGFVVEGYARDYLRIGGAWRDHVLTSLINERWVCAEDGSSGSRPPIR